MSRATRSGRLSERPAARSITIGRATRVIEPLPRGAIVVSSRGVSAPTTAVSTILVREPDDRLSLSITSPDGQVTRWGGDEINSEYVPTDLTFSTSVPGGFRDLSCSLLRGLNPGFDEGLFRDVRAYGPGNRTAWEGRMAQLPRTNTAVRPGAVGWSAHPRGRQELPRDLRRPGTLSKGHQPGVSRRIAINSLPPLPETSKTRPVIADTTPPRRLRVAALGGLLSWSWLARPGTTRRRDPDRVGLLRLEARHRRLHANASYAWGAVPLEQRRRNVERTRPAALRAAGPRTGSVVGDDDGAAVRVPAAALHGATHGHRAGVELSLYWTALAVSMALTASPSRAAGTATHPPVFSAPISSRTQSSVPHRFSHVTTGADGSIQWRLVRVDPVAAKTSPVRSRI